MAKIKNYQYTVKGRGQFPIDMLRYDIASPKSEEDSSRIETSHRRGSYNTEFLIAIISSKSPTIERWSSFGWTVFDLRISSY